MCYNKKDESTDAHASWRDQVSPLEQLHDDVFVKAGLEVFIKRDDLLKPYGGNKWRKLKYHFLQMVDDGHREFLTFGGPFSNHIYASASLAREQKLDATFFIRGSVDDRNNPVLNHVRNCGVELVSLDRKTYGNRYTQAFKSKLQSAYPGAFYIPEGGASKHGLKGCSEIVNETVKQIGSRPDYWIVGAGTANTAAGIAGKLQANEKVIAISALRNEIIQTAFRASLGLIPVATRQRLVLSASYHFGGMAKWNEELILFMQGFEKQHGILLDPIYTGKAMYGLYDLVTRSEFERGSTIVFVHTGGMPGRMGFNYRFEGLLSDPGR